MATNTVPIAFGNMVPTDGNLQFVPYASLENTGSLQDFMTLRMSGTADSEVNFFGVVPDDYGSSPILVVWWTSETTTDDVVFRLQHRVHTPGTTVVDIATSPSTISQLLTITADRGATSELQEDTLALTDTDFVGEAGSPWHGIFSREAATEAADTLVDPVSVIGIALRYTTA